MKALSRIVWFMVQVTLIMMIDHLLSSKMPTGGSRTPASKTAIALQNRYEALLANAGPASVVAAGVKPIATAGNATFLAGLNAIGGVSTLATFGGAPTLAELTGHVQDIFNEFNTLVTSMASSNFT